MDYAIIRTGGKQYKVSKNLTLNVDKLEGKKGDTLKISDVLLVAKDGKITVGDPTVAKAEVNVKIVDQIKGEKVRVAKFRAKSRHRRVTGFREQLTKIEVQSI